MVPRAATQAELEVEALLVASPAPVERSVIADRLGALQADRAIEGVRSFWAGRGMRLVERGGAVWMEPSPAARKAIQSVSDGVPEARLTKAAMETLSFVAVNQPVTLADIEAGRGVAQYRGIMSTLVDAGLVRITSRRTDAGRSAAYVTTEAFLERFGLPTLSDLPSPEEMASLSTPPSDPEASCGEGDAAPA